MVTQREIKAEITREKILEAAADEMYRVGFQAASLCDILTRLGISKGALYHHFPSKLALGYAVLDDVLLNRVGSTWDTALSQEDPIEGLCDLLEAEAQVMSGMRLTCGCPLNNLAQEMSPVDEGFRQRIEKIYRVWQRRIQNALAGAQQRGVLRDDFDAGEVAYFIIASLQGAVGLAKNAQDCGIFRSSIKGLSSYLKNLKKVPS
ncbi:MAG: TetR/AcrR family transcriptional regulator [Proteobacteria bacterium]|nr:TetR/AcrR family transcriptional regulator [Pseudomonadota bacterium]